MTRGTFLKFLFLSQSNIKRFLIVNLLLLLPSGAFIYSLIRLVPVAKSYMNSSNVNVEHVSPEHEKLAVVISINRSREEGEYDEGRVYVFDRRDFNRLRKHIFLRRNESHRDAILEENSLGFSDISFFASSITINDKSGNPLVALGLEDIGEDVLEILLINPNPVPGRTEIIVNLLLFIAGFTLTFGSLGGVSDYTQRVVFHETRDFKYFFQAVKRYFIKSFTLGLFFAIVFGAVVLNIYFYIFIISNDISVFIAAVNFWMLVIFIFIFLWVYPLFILNRDESIWKVMRKSLFISFDNFDFTFRSLLLVFLMFFISCFTVFIIPGFTGVFSFLNSALKDISYRYARLESA
ncbi:MAG: hypothetical protein ACUVWJ_03290 [Spirochaetota bacterium]